MTNSPKRPRLCFTGPMVGRNAGKVTTQGEFVADALAGLDYPTFGVSDSPNRFIRPLDIAWKLIVYRKRIDVQIAQIYTGRSFAIEDMTTWMGRKFGHRLVLHAHGGAMPEFIKRHPKWTARVFRRAEDIIVPSLYLQRVFEWLGFEATIIPNFVYNEIYPFLLRTAVRPKMLWMRGFHEVYNPKLAIRALVELRKHFPEATLTMAGPNSGALARVIDFAKAMGVADAVRFPGFLNMDQKVEAGREHDIFVNTSRVDNMPVSLIEASMMGLPIVATCVGGIPDMFTNEETAVLVRDDDSVAVADAVTRLLRTPALAEKLSFQARKQAEQWTWDTVKPLWQTLIDGHGQRLTS